ncbi:MAG: RecX family transcriptional regulator [Bacteroides sp.]|nr:RecX family transcriptional regulator [Bacteroides sp.]MBD5353136.1 RecX family transcriptional regulator [Bacteroides sp.]MBD5359135.1 RecX family transcriptional regulator [Bacteroides sp.]MBD5365197.1 RecX family transcriptional regulator [Bacteroides sp.]
MKKELTPDEARARLMDLCACGEYSSGEALERLRKWGIRGAAAIEIVQRLIDERFIDDERFARAFVRAKVAYSGWGRIKIRAAMAQKGIERELIDLALEEEIDDETYCSNLAEALRSKARTMPEVLDSDCRAKLLRFAASRGYEPGLIMEMLPEEDFWRYEADD